MKTIFRTVIILLITGALGWGTYLLIQRSPQASVAGGFDREPPAFSEGTPQTRPEGFRGEGGEFEGREGFGAIGGVISIVAHILLFAVVTFLFAVFGKLLPQKTKTVEDAP